MVVEIPTLAPALQAVSQYAESRQATLTPQHAEILLEIHRRLERLTAQVAELIELNNRLWARQGFNVDFDPATNALVVSVGGTEQRLKLKRADPNVPMQVRRRTAGSAYYAGMSQPSDDEEQKLRVELEERLESYYQSAHRILKLFRRVPDLGKIRERLNKLRES